MRNYNQDYFKVGGSRIEDPDEARLNRLSKKAIEARRVGKPKKSKPRRAAIKKAKARKEGKAPSVAGAAATKPRAKGTLGGDPMAHVAAPKPTKRKRATAASRTTPRTKREKTTTAEVPAERLPNALPNRLGGMARQLFAAPFTVARLLKQLRNREE